MIIDFLLDDIRKAIADIEGEVSGLTAESFASVDYVSSAKTIYFYNAADEEVGSIDTTDFVVDGMIDTVSISGNVLHFVFNTDAGKQPIDVDLSSVMPALDEYWTSAETKSYVDSASTVLQEQIDTMDEVVSEALVDLNERIDEISGGSQSDSTRLISVEELPASAETGTVMALYQEGEAGGGTWTGPEDNHYTFNCDFSKLDTAQTYDIAYFPGDGGYNYSNTCLKYVDGVWSVYTVATDGTDGEDTIQMIYPLAIGEHHELYTYATYGSFEDEELALDGNVLITDGETIMAGQYEDGVWGSLNDFNGALSAGAIHLYNISGEAGEPILGLYQYDGQNWNEIGADVDLSAYWTSAQTKTYVDTGFWASAQTKDYVDSAITAVEDHITDVEKVTASALTELHDDILELSGSSVDLSGYYTSGETDAAISAATAGKADAANVTANTGSLRFPLWNTQGVITGLASSNYFRQEELKLNGSNYYVVETGTKVPPIYAPTTSGNPGEVLISTGNGAPVWSAMTFPTPDVDKAYVDSAITEVQEQIDTMDDVVSAALVDLNDRKVESASVSTIWKGTQVEYDAIVTKDASTLYIIVNNS